MTKIKFHNTIVTMPFGEYKDRTMREIPSNYLRWIMEDVENEKLRTHAEIEFLRRTDENDHWYC